MGYDRSRITSFGRLAQDPRFTGETYWPVSMLDGLKLEVAHRRSEIGPRNVPWRRP